MENLLKFICGTANSEIDRIAFWTFFLTLVTGVLCYIGWKQLSGINRVSKADFLKKFDTEFFNEKTKFFMLLIDYNALVFKIKEIAYGEDIPTKSLPYFLVDFKIAKQLELHKGEANLQEYYTGFDIDDCLLGYFENIGCYEKDRLISIQGVYDNFDWYIQKVWTNSAIISYVSNQRETEGSDIFENFEYIYDKCRSFGEAKANKTWIWWWRIKWAISN